MTNACDANYQGLSQSVTYPGSIRAAADPAIIVTGELHMNGTMAAITMNLFPYGFAPQRQVALVQ